MCRKKVKVSSNLYRGKRIKDALHVYFLSCEHKSIAWRREDGSYLLLPASFVDSWSDCRLKKAIYVDKSLFETTKIEEKPSFWSKLHRFFCA